MPNHDITLTVDTTEVQAALAKERRKTAAYRTTAVRLYLGTQRLKDVARATLAVDELAQDENLRNYPEAKYQAETQSPRDQIAEEAIMLLNNEKQAYREIAARLFDGVEKWDAQPHDKHKSFYVEIDIRAHRLMEQEGKAHYPPGRTLTLQLEAIGLHERIHRYHEALFKIVREVQEPNEMGRDFATRLQKIAVDVLGPPGARSDAT